MASFAAGILLKELREQKGLSQKEVCSGICAISTLSRIENGTQQPYALVFNRLMARLGENPNKFYFNVASREEFEFISQMSEIDALIFDREFTEAELQLQAIENSPKVLELTAAIQTENSDEKSCQRLELQLVFIARAAIDFNVKQNFDDVETLLLQAIRLTIPTFEEQAIHTYLLTVQEATIINWLAAVQFSRGDVQKSLEILFALKKTLDTQHSEDFEKANIYTNMLHSLTKILSLQKRYTEAIALCDLGLLICRKTKMFRSAPYLLTNKAYCLHQIGEDEECRVLLKNAYHALLVHGEHKVAEMVRNGAKKDFDIEI